MTEVVERMVHDALAGANAANSAIGDLELQFEVWFNYFLSNVGERNLFNKAQIYDDLTFNMDGYTPTVFPVVSQLLRGMSSVGMDIIRPTKSSPLVDDAPETFGSMIADDLDDMHWILFTVIEPKHPYKGVRYATAYRNGELIYPPVDPTFTDYYPDEKVMPFARGIFIDIRERFLQNARPDIFVRDAKGNLLP